MYPHKHTYTHTQIQPFTHTTTHTHNHPPIDIVVSVISKFKTEDNKVFKLTLVLLRKYVHQFERRKVFEDPEVVRFDLTGSLDL